MGESEQSQLLNDQSVAINRARPGTAAELGSMWPRIASGFLSLNAGRLDEVLMYARGSHAKGRRWRAARTRQNGI